MRAWVFSLVFFISVAGYGQMNKLPIQAYEYDTSYIQNFGNLLAVRLVSPRRIYDFRLKNRDTNERLNYRPNLQTAFGLGFTYRWLAFDVVFNPKWNRKKTLDLGETKEFNIKGTLYLQKYMLDVVFRTYKGLHISNPDAYLNPWDGVYPYRPDIRTTNFIITFAIPSNYKKYSPKTTFQLDGRMKKSAGSVMFLSSIHMSFMSADSTILPTEFESAFDPKANITASGFINFRQSVGYAYTFVYKRFYATLSAFPGLALTIGSVDSEGGRYAPVNFNLSFSSKSGLGYNSRRWYAGLYFIYYYQNIKLTKELAYNSNLGEWRLFVGYRFKAPYLVHSVISN